MAKQTGPIKITGTYGNICFYEMEGNFYARLKSSLTGKRVKKDPRFRRTMAYAGMLKMASKLASSCYRSLPEEERQHSMYRALTGMAMQMLKEGIEAEEIAMQLEGVYKQTEEKAANPSMHIDENKREKIPVAAHCMHVNEHGKLIFTGKQSFFLSCSKPNTVRPETGQSSHHPPLIINTISAGIPFVPN